MSDPDPWLDNSELTIPIHVQFLNPPTVEDGMAWLAPLTTADPIIQFAVGFHEGDVRQTVWVHPDDADRARSLIEAQAPQSWRTADKPMVRSALGTLVVSALTAALIGAVIAGDD